MFDGTSGMGNQVYAALAVGLMVAVFSGLIGKVLRNRLAPVRTVRAKVIQKQRQELFSKYAGTGKRYRYVATFLAEGKKLSFYVSEFSFGGYKLNETGTLKYKGSRIIAFH